MKNMRKIGMVSALILMVVAAVLMTGCQKPPDTEMQAAQAAMEAAKAGEAEKYAQNELATASATMDQVNTEIEAQKAKWMPNYDKAKEMIAQAKTQADAAKEAAIAGKEKAKSEATQAIADAKAMVAGAEAGLKTAPKGKGTKADLEMMGKDIEGYKQSITDAEGLMGTEDYMGARDKAKAAMDGAKVVQDSIVAAGGKIPEVKPAEAAPAAAEPAAN
jgi:chromosome segregation ATPase